MAATKKKTTYQNTEKTTTRRTRRAKKADPAGTAALLAAGLLALLLGYLPGEALWATVRGYFFGVLGVSMYLAGPVLLYLAWQRMKRKPSPALYLQAVFLALIISALPLAFSAKSYEGVKLLDAVIEAFQEGCAAGWKGGVAGLLLGATLSHYCGHLVACLLLVLFILVDAYLFLPIAPGYILQQLRSVSEDGRDKLNDARERRAEAARRGARLQEENDRRRAARKEREAALAAPRRQTNLDIDLGPDPLPREEDAQPAQSRFGGLFSSARSPRPGFDVSLGGPELPEETALPLQEVEPEVVEIGPGGTFGMNPLSSSAPSPAAAEPDISDALGGEFDTPLELPGEEPPAAPLNDSDLWASMGDPDVILAEVPAPAAPAPAPEASAMGGDVERLIHKAAVNGSMHGEAEATLEQENSHSYNFPPIDLLEKQADTDDSRAAAEMRKNADILVNTLDSFGVRTNILDICRGPSVTRYELQPQVGVKISRITSLSDDIALNLAKAGVRIEAPIPGKPAVGIEVPNDIKTSVSIRGILESQAFVNSKSPLTLALGKDIDGTAHVADLCRMPHLLIAGSTGSGKSVCVNSIIMSFLYRSSPEEVRLILIDPKVVELAEYNGIPHLLMPVVTEPRKAAGALGSAVAEMERRYHQFAENNVRDIKTFNKLAAVTPGLEKMPYIAIVIDELADLMMVSGKEVEDYICRIAQKARAAGMHLIVATQRPSVDVITGLIKANIPSRIAFAVSSQVDSRTILDGAGAEKLLGMGDMLFLPVGAPKPVRIQGTYVKDEEITAVLNYVKTGSEAQYDEGMIAAMERMATQDGGSSGSGGDGSHDSMFEQVVEIVVELSEVSTSMLQRKCKLGYARAARIMDEMEQEGIIGPYEGARPRKVLMNRQMWIERKMSQSGGEV